MITFIFEKTDTKTLNAIALTTNLSSNRVILKCGFTFQNVVELDDEPYNHYTLEKEAWAGGL
jgi:RimJ/RimL family protein N-acetyltransferase